MMHDGNRRMLMFSNMAKLVLATVVSFALLLIPALYLVLNYGEAGAKELMLSSPLFLVGQSLGLFLLPLLLYRNGRRTVSRALRGAAEKLDAINLKTLLIYLGICIGGSALLGFMSEYLVKLMPKAWGIATEDDTAQFVARMLKNHSPFYLLEILAVAIVPAFVEELFFRATLQRYVLVGIKKPIIAILITAAIFSLVHLSFIGFASRMWIGFVLGWAYYKSENIYLPIRIHALNNLFALIIMIVGL